MYTPKARPTRMRFSCVALRSVTMRLRNAYSYAWTYRDGTQRNAWKTRPYGAGVKLRFPSAVSSISYIVWRLLSVPFHIGACEGHLYRSLFHPYLWPFWRSASWAQSDPRGGGGEWMGPGAGSPERQPRSGLSTEPRRERQRVTAREKPGQVEVGDRSKCSSAIGAVPLEGAVMRCGFTEVGERRKCPNAIVAVPHEGVIRFGFFFGQLQ